jgi:hypothetical protein
MYNINCLYLLRHVSAFIHHHKGFYSNVLKPDGYDTNICIIKIQCIVIILQPCLYMSVTLTQCMCSYSSAWLMLFYLTVTHKHLLPVPWSKLVNGCVGRVTWCVVLFRRNLVIYSIIWLTCSIPVAWQSKAWVCSRSFAGIAGSNPTGKFISCERCVLSSRVLLVVGPITRPEEFFLLWCVWVWSWSPYDEETLAH